MAMPSPSQLAALGPVLCLYRPQRGGELEGWRAAVRASACCDIDSECLRECICFYDRAGDCCWRLYLLSDSDFLAWEYLLEGLPAQAARAPDDGIAQRLWSRLAQCLGGERWQASLLRFHLPSSGLLAATLTPVSRLGEATARRLARAEGLDNDNHYQYPLIRPTPGETMQ